jgi:hypothetical protein
MFGFNYTDLLIFAKSPYKFNLCTQFTISLPTFTPFALEDYLFPLSSCFSGLGYAPLR